MGPPQLLLGRFVGSTPVTLFRIQSAAKVSLRVEAAQCAAGRASFDIASDADGFVHARDASETKFLGPNGMSMRPEGRMLAVIAATFRTRARIFEVPAGTRIPPELVLFHEHSDHYAMQPASRMTLAQCNAALSAFLLQDGVRLHKSVADFNAAHPWSRELAGCELSI